MTEEPPADWCDEHTMWDCDECKVITDKLPKYAVVRGRGRCRVMSYEGNGYFSLLTNRDVRLFKHRTNLTFVK